MTLLVEVLRRPYRGAWMAALIGLLPTILFGQGPAAGRVDAKPDLSGTWTLITEISEPNGDGAFGAVFSATQDAGSLRVRLLAGHPGRGSGSRSIDPVRELLFRFDGSETNVSTITNGSSASRRWNTASWRDGQLVVVKHWHHPNGVTSMAAEQVMWIVSNGSLVVQTERKNGGGPSVRMRNYYRKRLDTASAF